MARTTVRSLILRADALLREDKRDAARVKSIASALESNGVTWVWQLAYMKDRDWNEVGVPLGLKTAVKSVLASGAGEGEAPAPPDGDKHGRAATECDVDRRIQEDAALDLVPPNQVPPEAPLQKSSAEPQPERSGSYPEETLLDDHEALSRIADPLERLPERLQRFLLCGQSKGGGGELLGQGAAEARPLRTLDAMFLPMMLQPLEDQIEHIRGAGAQLAVLCALLLQVTSSFHITSAADRVSIHRAMTDSLHLSDVKEGITMLMTFLLYLGVYVGEFSALLAHVVGSNGSASGAFVEPLIRSIGSGYVILYGAFMLNFIVLVWDSLTCTHPVLGVPVAAAGLGAHFWVGHYGYGDIFANMSLEIFHLPRWLLLTSLDARCARRAFVRGREFQEDVNKRAEVLRQRAVDKFHAML